MDQKLPSVVIVGRPNVGKSTLFNRITESRRAIVTDEPGITRDRIYGRAQWEGRAFELVDTGGIVPDEKAGIPAEIYRQARVAIDAAAVVVLVVDARAGVQPLDQELARLMQRTGKPVIVAANKVDTQQQAPLAADFLRLAKRVVGVSAEHGYGVDELLDEVVRTFPAAAGDAGASAVSEPVRVAIIGRPNVGKSTLLNRLAGEERAIVWPEAGTTRDTVDTRVEREGRAYVFVDTAGIRRKAKTKLVAEKLSVVMAQRHLAQADVALMLLDGEMGATSQDAAIAHDAAESGRSVILVLNKWDLALAAAERAAAAKRPTNRRGEDRRDARYNERKDRRRAVRASREAQHSKVDAARLRADYEKLIREKLKFLAYAPLVFVSSLSGEHLDRLLALIDRVNAARQRRVSTSELNRWLKSTDLERGTVPGAQRVKILYLTQSSANPPTFVLFTNQSRPLHFSYQRFLENRLRASFDFTGAPIRFRQRFRQRG